MLRQATVLLGALIGLARCPDALAESAQASQTVIGGEVRLSHDAVVAIASGERVFCSGVLISPRVVLTAAHCIPENVNGLELLEIEVWFVDESGVPDRREVSTGRTHPLWRDLNTRNDIGMLALADSAPVGPAILASGERSSLLVPGIELVAAGFGRSEKDSPGRKRDGVAIVTRVTESTIELESGPSITCDGDSGGPLFETSLGKEVVVGVHSRSNCSDTAIDERVDVHLEDFIRPFVAVVEAEEICAGDGICDESCANDNDCLEVVGGCRVANSQHSQGAIFLVLLLTLIATRRRSINLYRRGSTWAASRGSRQPTP